jgi:hypothetical protein
MGIKFMLDGPSCYQCNPQRLARGHKNAAGYTGTIDDLFKGIHLYSRTMSFGVSKGYKRRLLIKFKHRNMVLWVADLVTPSWLNRSGNSYLRFCRMLFSIRKNYGVDLINYFQIILSPTVYGKFILSRNRKLFAVLRNIYWMLKYGKKYPDEYEYEK